ncbi:Rhs element Vgr protein [Duganella sp. CF517]|uniref:type VI secretion system tip protein VgrG n=1 Tax=Duganella sp. CF517 TaxID=1881038 RepID=UPI0008CDB9EA|nr:type VI secretion system tip protein VgrG [Duganella sp. CF517]SEN77413.1 Rhs element Vgr protein [Duganella sp. CF517]
MPAPSPLAATDGPVNLVIRSNGTKLADQYRVISLVIGKGVNKLSQARLIVADGDMAQQQFELSDGDALVPGAKIEIEAGYGAAATLIFAGVVVRHGLQVGGDNDSRLVIECRHAAFPLTLARNNANHVATTDGDAIGAILAAAGVDATVATTEAVYDGLVQFYSSDWDFVLARAEANGLLVVAGDAAVTVKAPSTATEPVLTLTYGIDLQSFEADIDARTQYAEVTGVCWDPATQQVVEQQAEPPSLGLQGDLTAAKLAEVGGVAALRLQTPVPLATGALKAWAGARQMKAALARVRGTMRFQGSALALPDTTMSVAGVGTRFSGQVYVSAVEHTFADGNWYTDAEFGLAPEWTAAAGGAGGGAEAASGLLPGASGLHIGVVSKLDEDPAAQHRVQVVMPVSQNKTKGVWARLASAYGSETVGAFFIPEIGDEVLVGYFNNDPGNPVVLASLYSSKRAPPYPLTADNFIKAIVTKGLLKVEFDDDKKVMTLLTPAGNTVVMSDDAKSIVMTDQNGNKVALDEKGILLDSPFDVVIKAGGKITHDAGANIESTAGADLKQSALNINSNASMSLVAKGASSAELSAAGQVTVKGAMVAIN